MEFLGGRRKARCSHGTNSAKSTAHSSAEVVEESSSCHGMPRAHNKKRSSSSSGSGGSSFVCFVRRSCLPAARTTCPCPSRPMDVPGRGAIRHDAWRTRWQRRSQAPQEAQPPWSRSGTCERWCSWLAQKSSNTPCPALTSRRKSQRSCGLPQGDRGREPEDRRAERELCAAPRGWSLCLRMARSSTSCLMVRTLTGAVDGLFSLLLVRHL